MQNIEQKNFKKIILLCNNINSIKFCTFHDKSDSMLAIVFRCIPLDLRIIAVNSQSHLVEEDKKCIDGVKRQEE